MVYKALKKDAVRHFTSVRVNRDNADRLFYHLYEGVSPEDLKRKEKQEEEVPIKKGQKA